MEAIVRGRLGKDPEVRKAGEQTVGVLRVAEHQLSKERERGDAVLWVDVEIWGDLAERCASTLHKGDAVIIHGRWAFKEWTAQDGTNRGKTFIKGWAVGADLVPNVTVALTRHPRPGSPAAAPARELESDPFDES